MDIIKGVVALDVVLCDGNPGCIVEIEFTRLGIECSRELPFWFAGGWERISRFCDLEAPGGALGTNKITRQSLAFCYKTAKLERTI